MDGPLDLIPEAEIFVDDKLVFLLYLYRQFILTMVQFYSSPCYNYHFFLPIDQELCITTMKFYVSFDSSIF